MTEQYRVILTVTQMRDHCTIRSAGYAETIDNYPQDADLHRVAEKLFERWQDAQWKPGDVVILKDGAKRLERTETVWHDDNDGVYADIDIDRLRYNGKLHAHIRDQVMRVVA